MSAQITFSTTLGKFLKAFPTVDTELLRNYPERPKLTHYVIIAFSSEASSTAYPSVVKSVHDAQIPFNYNQYLVEFEDVCKRINKPVFTLDKYGFIVTNAYDVYITELNGVLNGLTISPIGKASKSLLPFRLNRELKFTSAVNYRLWVFLHNHPSTIPDELAKIKNFQNWTEVFFISIPDGSKFTGYYQELIDNTARFVNQTAQTIHDPTKEEIISREKVLWVDLNPQALYFKNIKVVYGYDKLSSEDVKQREQLEEQYKSDDTAQIDTDEIIRSICVDYGLTFAELLTKVNCYNRKHLQKFESSE